MNDHFLPSPKKGIFLFLFASFFYFLNRAIGNHLQGHLQTEQILFMQNFVALICLLPSFSNQRQIWKTSQRTIHLIRAFSAMASHYLCLLALQSMTFVDVTTLHFTSAFFIPLISFVWFKEKLPPLIWLTIAIGFSGVALILNPSWEIFQTGSLFVLGAALAAALGMSAVRNLNLLQEPKEKTLLYVFSVGTTVMAGPCFMNWVSPTFNEWVLLVAVGLCVMINHSLIVQSFKHAPAAYLSPLSYSTIVYAAIFGWLFLNESMDIETILGSMLIALGGYLTYVFSSKKQGAPSERAPL